MCVPWFSRGAELIEFGIKMELLEWLSGCAPSQQWPSPDRKAKDLRVAQTMSLAVSAVPIWCWSPR